MRRIILNPLSERNVEAFRGQKSLVLAEKTVHSNECRYRDENSNLKLEVFQDNERITKLKSSENNTKYKDIIKNLEVKIKKDKKVLVNLESENIRLKKKIKTMLNKKSNREIDNNNLTEKIGNENKNLLEKLKEKDLFISQLTVQINQLKANLREESIKLQIQGELHSEKLREYENEFVSTNEKFNEILTDERIKVENLQGETELLIPENDQLQKETAILKHIKELEDTEVYVLNQEMNSKKKIEELEKRVAELEEMLINQNIDHQKKVDTLNQLLKEKNVFIQKLNEKMAEANKQFEDIEFNLTNELINLLEYSEKNTEMLINLNKEKDQIYSRYNALRNSKLGKLTIKYWNFKKLKGDRNVYK